MKRRSFCAAAVSIGVAIATRIHAQNRGALRVAWASIEPPNSRSPFFEAFRSGMRDLGYTEGTNLTIDRWWGDGSEEKLAAQVDGIVKSRPSVIVAQGGLALHPLIVAHVAAPIVFAISAEPVEARIAQTYARPGGNATGMTFFALDLVGKRMQIMKEALPALERVAVLADPEHPGQHKELDAAQVAADSLGLQVRYFPVSSEERLDSALADVAQNRYDAILAFADGFTQSFAARIAGFSARYRIPAVDGWSSFARQGNLLTYGPVLEDCYRRLADYVDRISKGANAGELPIELPTTVELVINLKTAQALGLTIPQSLLARANEVIQ
jgi:putative ABC transport system substrate-binding protein